ncbi:unnamed protein product, partial [Rotaria sordida]
MLLLENVHHRLFITPIINLTKNSICLTYYYYLTENKTVLLSSYYLNQQGDTFSLDKTKHNLLFLENDEISSSIYPDSITQTDYLLNIT